MATPEQNKATCQEFVQRVFHDGDMSYAQKMIAEDFVDHSPPPGAAGDKASTIAMFRQMSEQVPRRQRARSST